MAEGEQNEGYQLYHYDPSVAAAAVFTILFLTTSLFHTWQMFKHKTWFFVAFIVGGLFECIGYAGRAYSAHEAPDFTLGPYIVQSLLLLLGPSFFAASIYMILGRIIRLTGGQDHSPIRPTRLTKIFVLGDVLSFFVQSAGGGMLANAQNPDTVKLANNILLGGLILQVLFFGLFIAVAGIFHKRMRADPMAMSSSSRLPWERYLLILYLSSLLIVLRCVFRIIEYAGGQDGVLLSNEIYLYVFEATLMFLVMVVFNVQHPSMIIGRDKIAEYRMADLIS